MNKINSLDDILNVSGRAFMSGGLDINIRYKIKTKKYKILLDSIHDITKRIKIDNFEQFFINCISSQDFKISETNEDVTYSKIIRSYDATPDWQIDIIVRANKSKKHLKLKLMNYDMMVNILNITFADLE